MHWNTYTGLPLFGFHIWSDDVMRCAKSQVSATVAGSQAKLDCSTVVQRRTVAMPRLCTASDGVTLIILPGSLHSLGMIHRTKWGFVDLRLAMSLNSDSYGGWLVGWRGITNNKQRTVNEGHAEDVLKVKR